MLFFFHQSKKLKNLQLTFNKSNKIILRETILNQSYFANRCELFIFSSHLEPHEDHVVSQLSDSAKIDARNGSGLKRLVLNNNKKILFDVENVSSF
jgi:hypothetical protein